ncbi:cupin domain-containing protein [Desulfovibrio inopinatus]|uniref:cupin domain-containing protein n=1 Tax=Desulfovibrio inopinatus TaxID=102109 RepID=UPI0004015305|nr:cupin domain-containing protein [Desulfovibrio inopinatus]
MKTLNIFEKGPFQEKGMGSLLVHDSPYFKILNFNFEPGQELPIHSHDIEGELMLTVVEGEGEFLGENKTLPAKAGDVLIADIAEPHGVRATTRMRVLVCIAPPI